MSSTRLDMGVIAIALVLPSIITWNYFFRAESASAGIQLAIFNAVKVLQFMLPIVWVLAVQRGRLSLRPGGAGGLAIGLGFGIVVAAGIALLYAGVLRSSDLLAAASHQIQAKVLGWGIDSLGKYVALSAFYCLVHSLLEEYYWRWFIFGQLRRRWPLTAAIAVSSLGFMAHHVLVLGKFFGFDHWATWALSGCVAVGGAVWAWLYDRSGSLLGPWVSHLFVDAAIFAVGYDLVRSVLMSG